MVRVVVVDGSHRAGGMTSALVNGFIGGVISMVPDADVLVIPLRDTRVEFCTGCNGCTGSPGPIGKCSIDDGVGRLLPQLLECDVLVFASPVYELGPSALMKRFMERCLPAIRFGIPYPKGRNPARKGKLGVVLLSSGAPHPFNVAFGYTRYPNMILKMMCKF
jgi:multimeric flavodoxin WrbA